MKEIVAALAFAVLIPAVRAAEIHGAWTAEARESGRLQLNLSRRNHQFGETMNLADFAGLPAAALDATAQTPVNFTLQREAGNVAFEGTFKNGFGAGQFTFTPNPAYASTLRTLGVTFDGGELDDDHLMTMAMLDVSSAYIRSMQAEGYRVTGDKYVAMRMFRVTPEFIRELKDAGYEHIPPQKLVAMRIHGIDADYVKRMNAAK